MPVVCFIELLFGGWVGPNETKDRGQALLTVDYLVRFGALLAQQYDRRQGNSTQD